MLGGRVFASLLVFCVIAAVMMADDSAPPRKAEPGGPPKAKVEPVTDDLHEHKITDNYRWLEDASSADTQEFVREEMAYTRSVLDPLPGREKMQQRLTELASTGTM